MSPSTAFLDATALAAAIRTRELSSRELLDLYLARIASLNPRLNAVVTLDAERAGARADAADAALARGESRGPLHGLPITIKDSFETEGLRTTSGAKAFAEHVPAADAVAVARLEAAGAIVFGKTNLPTFAMDLQSYNPLFGVSRNPWDASRTPGGSSGGAAAAVAAGLTAFELGSDIGGSIRTPAHFCGIYGHKPSYGLVPQRGHIPGPPGTLAEPDIAVAGPMARSARDCALLLDILAGADAEAGVAWRLQLPAARATQLRDFRVAAWIDEPACPSDTETRRVHGELVEALRKAGVAVDERARPALDFAAARDRYLELLYAATSPGLPPSTFDALLAAAQALPPDDDSPAGRVARGSTLRHRDWLRLHEARLRMRRAWTTFFSGFDVLLCPVTPTAAFAHDHSEPLAARRVTLDGTPHPYLELLSWAGLIGMAGLPSTVAPVGMTREGLPVGVQIVGAFLEDRTPLAFAAALAEVHGGYRPPPGC